MTLSDRQAADIRASRVAAEVQNRVMLLASTNARHDAFPLRGALRDGVRELRERLVEIYASMPGATEPAVRDELVAWIQRRGAAMVQSCVASVRGANVASAARLAARLIPEYTLSVPNAFDLKVHDAEAVRRAQEAALPVMNVYNFSANQVGAQGPNATAIGITLLQREADVADGDD